MTGHRPAPGRPGAPASGPARREAPGKLFIAGEYAVIEPGHPAILVAVDRRVSVTVSASDREGTLIESDLSSGPVRPSQNPVVASALAVVEELLAARGRTVRPMRVSIESRLHRDGVKFGLGSSGAVTVAAVAAAAAHAGLELSPDERFRLAMLATARRDRRASGGDLAASVWGGWIAYRSPDRAAVLELNERHGIEETLRRPWPGFELRPLPPPAALTLHVGWTGEPASTGALAARLDIPESFRARSDECVRAAIRAIERGDDRELMDRIREARGLLARLDEKAVFTDRLTALCDAAEAAGGAAKPSGAGGGDCGIALLDAEARTDQMRKDWVAAGVLPLPIQVEPTTNGTKR